MKLGEVSGPFFTQLTKDMEVKREQHGELYSPSCEGTAVFRGAGQQCASVVREDISGRSICPRHDLSGIGSPDSRSVGGGFRGQCAHIPVPLVVSGCVVCPFFAVPT